MAFTTRSANLNLLAGALSAGYRWIWFGDSFSSPNTARVPWATSLVWPFTGGLGAYFNPYVNQGTISTILNTAVQAAGHPYDGGESGSQNGRHLVNDAYLNYSRDGATGAAGDDWFGLPIHGIEWMFDSGGHLDPAGGSSNRLGRLRIEFADTMANGVNGRIWDTGSVVRARPVYFAHVTQTEMVDTFQATDGGGLSGDATTLDLKADARLMFHRGGSHGAGAPVAGTLNSTVTRFVIDQALTANPDIGILRTDPGSQDWFLALAGFLFEVDGKESNAQLQTIADSSWSQEGHADDTASTQASPKQYTTTQLTDFLDITTTTRTKRPVLVYYLASENESAEDVATDAAAWRTRAKAACAAIGLPAPLIVLVGTYLHDVTGAADDAAAVEDNNTGLLTVAQANPADTVFLSLYAMTDGVLFDGTQPALDWLDENGLATFYTGATLRDVSDGILLDNHLTTPLHPADTDAACLFARVLLDEIQTARSGVRGRQRSRGRMAA